MGEETGHEPDPGSTSCRGAVQGEQQTGRSEPPDPQTQVDHVVGEALREREEGDRHIGDDPRHAPIQEPCRRVRGAIQRRIFFQSRRCSPSMTRASSSSSWIVADQVQETVDQQAGSLLVESAVAAGRLCRRGLDADDDVAEQCAAVSPMLALEERE